MPKGKKVTGAKAQRKIAIRRKKAKQKKLIIAGVCTLAVAAVIVISVLLSSTERRSEVFSNGIKLVELLPDGRFSANLAHNVRKSGTYTRVLEDNNEVIFFDTNGVIEVGWIEDNALVIPEQWDDFHNHGRVLPRR